LILFASTLALSVLLDAKASQCWVCKIADRSNWRHDQLLNLKSGRLDLSGGNQTSVSMSLYRDPIVMLNQSG
jgi:hypothetical protein